VLHHALPINIEMEIMDVDHVIQHAEHVLLLISVHHVLNQEVNQLTEFATHVFIHVLLVQLMKHVHHA
jgi:hypothetical protein